MLHAGRANLALVFERPSLDGREGFQEVSSETLVAVMAPELLARTLPSATGLREEHLTNTRQIVLASRDLATIDRRFAYARHCWRTDNHIAAGSLVEMPFDNLTNHMELWVDVVWSKERPLGLAARRFIERIAAAKTPT